MTIPIIIIKWNHGGGNKEIGLRVQSDNQWSNRAHMLSDLQTSSPKHVTLKKACKIVWKKWWPAHFWLHMQSNKKKGTTPLWPSIFFFSRLWKDDVSTTNSISHQCRSSYNHLQWESQLNPWPSDERPRPKKWQIKTKTYMAPFSMKIQLVSTQKQRRAQKRAHDLKNQDAS